MLKKLFAFRRYPEFIRFAWWRTVTPFILRRQGVVLGRGVSFLGSPIVSIWPESRILIDDRVSCCSVSEYTALGVNHPVILRTLRSAAVIKIGADTGISGASICASKEVIVGSRCLFGANVVVSDSDFHPISSANRRYNNNPEDVPALPVHIGNNVFLGTGCIVLKGVEIGDNSVIGAFTVVTKNVPANSVVAGNPMKIVRKLANFEM